MLLGPTAGDVAELSAAVEPRVEAMLNELALLGQQPDGAGISRLAWTYEDTLAREWFTAAARSRGLDVQPDRAGNLWAWWNVGAGPGVATGSHLDSVIGGGRLDGPLGVVAGLVAIQMLQEQGARPTRPIAVVVFADEEGARFNTPTFGSSLLIGRTTFDDLASRTDADGVTLADAITTAGHQADELGPDEAMLARVSSFVELHVEQGQALTDAGVDLAVCSQMWPHQRWLLRARGEANHAGTTPLVRRRDPMLVLAAAILGARRACGEMVLATIGRVQVLPNSANSIPAMLEARLDIRAATRELLAAANADFDAAVQRAARDEQIDVELLLESSSPGVVFDPALTVNVKEAVCRLGIAVGSVPTGAGHDAAVLQARLPSAMLFARNPDGRSHTPLEDAPSATCALATVALAAVLAQLSGCDDE